MDIDTNQSPLRTLAAWIQDAKAAGIKDPDAMALATASASGAPSVRMVLCRAIDDDVVRFFTNYESRKGGELEANAQAAAVFHWRELDRQVKVEGTVTRSSPAVSDAYFASRPRGNRIASSISPQSRPIESLDELRNAFAALETERAGKDVERPVHWGGFDVRVTAVELWRASPVRLHECIRYERSPKAAPRAPWRGARRAP